LLLELLSFAMALWPFHATHTRITKHSPNYSVCDSRGVCVRFRHRELWEESKSILLCSQFSSLASLKWPWSFIDFCFATLGQRYFQVEEESSGDHTHSCDQCVSCRSDTSAMSQWQLAELLKLKLQSVEKLPVSRVELWVTSDKTDTARDVTGRRPSAICNGVETNAKDKNLTTCVVYEKESGFVSVAFPLIA